MDIVSGLGVVYEVSGVGIHLESCRVALVIQAHLLALVERPELLLSVSVLLLHFTAESLSALLGLFHGLVSRFLVIPLFRVLSQLRQLLFELSLLLFNQSLVVSCCPLGLSDISDGLFVLHEGLNRYKLSELQILNEVLRILVDMERVEVLKEDVLRVANLLDWLTLGVLRLRGLSLVPEVHLHEG